MRLSESYSASYKWSIGLDDIVNALHEYAVSHNIPVDDDTEAWKEDLSEALEDNLGLDENTGILHMYTIERDTREVFNDEVVPTNSEKTGTTN